MAEIKLVYRELDDLAEHANKLASKCVEYSDELSSKVTRKISSLPRSPLSSDKASSASYYTKQKQSELLKKKDNYKAFAKSVDDLVDHAREADRNVGVSVNNSRENFLKEHTNLSGDGWSAFFASLVVDVPVLGWIVEKIQDIGEWGRNLKNTIRRWYEISGGKEIIDTVLAVAGVVLAVVGLIIAATASAGIVVFVAGIIGAVIGLINAIANLGTQLKANSCSDPAWAKYYGDQDKLSDVLRKKTFRGKLARFNKASMWAATTLDVVETICAVIDIGDGISKLYKRSGLNKLFSKKTTTIINGKPTTVYKFDFSTARDVLKSPEGRAKIKKTLKVSKKGLIFGDKGGWNVWKKQGGRAWKAIKTGDYMKVVKFSNNTIKKFKSGVEIGQAIQKGITYGFKPKDIYSIGTKGYSIGGYTGGIKTVTDINKQVSALKKIVS